MERECLRLLLRGNQPVVVCPARGIDNMRIPRDWRPALDDGRLLVLSPFQPATLGCHRDCSVELLTVRELAPGRLDDQRYRQQGRLLSIVRGISDISMISRLYEDYDNEFPNREAGERVFRNALRSISGQMGPMVRSTRFRRRAWFYSLMVSTCDVLEGIPGGMGPSTLQSEESVRLRMQDLHDVLKAPEPLQGLSDLHSTLSRATGHVRERRIRHEHFYDLLTLPDKAWEHRWQELGGAEAIARIRLL